MNGIDLLRQQHRELEELFEQYEGLDDEDTENRRELVREIADAFAIHATIEERHFYPATKSARTEDLLNEAIAEHTSVKRILTDLLSLDADDPRFSAQVKVAKEQIEHHVEEEEEDLFEKAEQMLDEDELDELGAEMQSTVDELRDEGSPSDMLHDQTEMPPPA